MIINERLNLVLPIYRVPNEPYAWVHSTPISPQVFESNHLLIAKTFAMIHSQGLGEIAGPKVAAMIMRDIAAGRSGTDTAMVPLLNEMRRLTKVVFKVMVVGGNICTIYDIVTSSF